MGGVIAIGLILAAGWLVASPGAAEQLLQHVPMLKTYTAGLDLKSVVLGFCAGALLGRLSGVRWGEALYNAVAFDGRLFRMLAWVGILGAVLAFY